MTWVTRNIFFSSYLPKQLNVDLGYAIDCQRTLDGDIRARVPWGGGAKRSNRARTEQPQVVKFTHLNDVVKSCDVDLQSTVHSKQLHNDKISEKISRFDGDYWHTSVRKAKLISFSWQWLGNIFTLIPPILSNLEPIAFVSIYNTHT